MAPFQPIPNLEVLLAGASTSVETAQAAAAATAVESAAAAAQAPDAGLLLGILLPLHTLACARHQSPPLRDTSLRVLAQAASLASSPPSASADLDAACSDVLLLAAAWALRRPRSAQLPPQDLMQIVCDLAVNAARRSGGGPTPAASVVCLAALSSADTTASGVHEIAWASALAAVEAAEPGAFKCVPKLPAAFPCSSCCARFYHVPTHLGSSSHSWPNL